MAHPLAARQGERSIPRGRGCEEVCVRWLRVLARLCEAVCLGPHGLARHRAVCDGVRTVSFGGVQGARATRAALHDVAKLRRTADLRGVSEGPRRSVHATRLRRLYGMYSLIYKKPRSAPGNRRRARRSLRLRDRAIMYTMARALMSEAWPNASVNTSYSMRRATAGGTGGSF